MAAFVGSMLTQEPSQLSLGSATRCAIFPSPPCGDGGLATEASLNTPEAVAFDAAGNLFIADHFAERVRRVDALTGIITTVAGTGANCLSETTCGDGGFGNSSAIASSTWHCR